MTKGLGPEWFSEDPTILARLYLDEIAGRYHSNWDALRLAARSSFLCAAKTFGERLVSWEHMNAKNQPRAAMSLVLELNYQAFVFGPILSPIFLGAVAVESFLRLCREVALAGSGLTGRVLELALAGLDVQPQHERLRDVLILTQAPPLLPELAAEGEALVAFRNACAHDAPFLTHVPLVAASWLRTLPKRPMELQPLGGRVASDTIQSGQWCTANDFESSAV